jgi:hypothetical protein
MTRTRCRRESEDFDESRNTQPTLQEARTRTISGRYGLELTPRLTAQKTGTGKCAGTRENIGDFHFVTEYFHKPEGNGASCEEKGDTNEPSCEGIERDNPRVMTPLMRGLGRPDSTENPLKFLRNWLTLILCVA